MSWRVAAALFAGLAVQLALTLIHLARLVVFLDFHQTLLGGLNGILLTAFLSGLTVGVIAQTRPLLLGALNAANPFGGYLFSYVMLLGFGALAAAGYNSFAGPLLGWAWQRLWANFWPHFAATLLASMAGASLGTLLTRPWSAAPSETHPPDRSPES